MLSPRGYGGLYGLMLASHRLLRYASPFLHLIALGTNAALLREGVAYRLAFAAQVGLVAAAVAPSRARPFLVARYYVLTTASVAAGLVDWLRHGTEAGWDLTEGTR
jgi:hypothetical protein